MKTHICFALLTALAATVAAGCASPSRPADEGARYRLARHYGLDGFDRVEAIRFTFNARVGAKHVRRTWLWKPASGEVTHWAGSTAAAETFTHPLPTGDDDARRRALDAKFVNDRYWLLFPLHLAWDQNAVVEEHAPAPRPLGPGEARRLTVRYPPAGGYTPGDIYELYIGAGEEIVEWVYRRGGDAQPTRMATWEDHRRVGPLTVSLTHNGPDGFKVWFSDVALRTRDSRGWHYPEG